MKYVAPECISKTGKASVLFMYVILTVISVYGCLQLKTYFSLDLYIDSHDWSNYDYIITKNEIMNKGFTPTTYVYTPDKDFYKEQY